MTTPCSCICTCTASLDQAGLPDFVGYPGPGSDWNSIPVGVTADGGEVMWDLWDAPHALVAGPMGSGKTVAQRVVAKHALAYPAHWKIVAIDPTGLEMGWLGGHEMADVYGPGEAAAGIATVHGEVERRIADKDESGQAILLIVAAVDALVKDEHVTEQIASIARWGRAARVHVHVGAQDPLRLPTVLRTNLDFRVATKALTVTESKVLFGTDQASALARVHGRSFVGVRNEGGPFQAYYVQGD